jgi:hypothetical protein
MRNIKLLTSIAAATLLATASSAWADSVSLDTSGNIAQETVNNNPVTNRGFILQWRLQGNGASSTVSANGAVSSVNVSNIANSSQTYVAVSAKADNIRQTTENNSRVNNRGIILSGPVTGRGASVTVSATGAASVVSVSSIK